MYRLIWLYFYPSRRGPVTGELSFSSDRCATQNPPAIFFFPHYLCRGIWCFIYIYRIFDLLNLIRDSFNFEIKKKIIKRFVSMDWLSLKIVITVVSMRCVRCFDWKYAPCALEWQIICLNNIPGVMYRIQYIPKFVWISNCDADYTIHSTMLINSWQVRQSKLSTAEYY